MLSMKDNRNNILAEMVAQIPEIVYGDSGNNEKFQNEVLRPILKFQHDVFIQYMASKFRQIGIDYNKLNPSDLRNKITASLSKDQKIRNQLLGMVLGLMSGDQLSRYFQNEQEFRKRIFSMLKERIIDGLETKF